MIARLLRGESRNLNNPNIPLDSMTDADWDDYGQTRGKSGTGVRVGVRDALTVSEYWRGVNLIANKVAATSLNVLKRKEGGGKEKDTAHPAFRLLRNKPNRYTTAFVFKQTIQGHALNCGNGYAYIYRDGAGEPNELLQLSPYCTWPVRANGVLYYVTNIGGTFDGVGQNGVAPTYSGGEWRKLPTTDVLHIKGLGFDGMMGYDLITYARESLGMSIGLRTYGSKYFSNGAHLGVVLETPNVMEEPTVKRMRVEWERMHQGLENAHRTAILENGVKASVLGQDARKTQLIEMRDHERVAIANFLNMSAWWLGDKAHTSYNSLEMVTQDFLDSTLDPWLCAWEGECDDKMLTEQQKNTDTHVIRFKRTELERVDFKTLREGTKIEVEGGWLTRAEARDRMDYEPDPTGEMSKPVVSTNVKIIEPAGDGEDDDLAFKREVVKQFIADGTISDVMFNLTDGRKLLDQVNIDTQPNYEEPWLPVIADSGPLVTGDVVIDPAGDIVGGDVEDSPPADGTGKGGNDPQKPKTDPGPKDNSGVASAARAARRRFAQGVTQAVQHGGSVGHEPGDEEGDEDDPDAVRTEFARIVALREKRRADMLTGVRDATRDAWQRIHKRIAVQAQRAAKDPSTFIAWVDNDPQLVKPSMWRENLKVIAEIAAPSAQLAAAMTGRACAPETLAKRYLAHVREQLLAVAECKPKDLAGAVEKWSEK